MNCSVQEAYKLAKDEPETFEHVLLIARAENIVETQLRKEHARG